MVTLGLPRRSSPVFAFGFDVAVFVRRETTRGERRLEAAGIEPASRDVLATASTCVVGGLISPRRRPSDRLRRGQPDVFFVGVVTRRLHADAARCLRPRDLAGKVPKTGCLVRQPLPSEDWQVNVSPRCLARPPWNLGTPPAPHSPGRIQFAPEKRGRMTHLLVILRCEPARRKKKTMR